MKEILVICLYFYSGINLIYFLIPLIDSFFGISLNDDFIKIQYKVNNQNKKIYIMGAVMHLCKKIKNIDFNKCTNLGAFISMVHIGVVWGLIFGGATLLSLIISIIYTIVVNFKEKNYNLPSDKKFLDYCNNVKTNSIKHLYDCENNLLAYKNKVYEDFIGCPKSFGLAKSKEICYDTSLSRNEDTDCEMCWKLALEGEVVNS